MGCLFIWGKCSGRIVETEAYAEHGDEACHTFTRPSTREFVTINSAGTSYVYLNYGMYWLMNVLCKCPDTGKNGFVLLRALEPVNGIATMQKRRNREKLIDLCSGPGKLSIALNISGDHHSKPLTRNPTRGFQQAPPIDQVLADRRIGISKATERRWRFLEQNNPHLSAPESR